jgi:hypothetical protein
MGRGRSVHEQPGTKVDRIASRQRRDSKKVKGNGRGSDKETSKGSKKGELRITVYCQSMYMYIIIV